ncbi:MAG: hypothetical protein A2075_06325 [Geobacteraceae bacterium GWC2_58_44]|nr:MAG: hypothetical protein A2075_06325 [Geobacteraceae bacterium GWC2_58_44]
MSKNANPTREEAAEADLGTTNLSPAVKWFLLLAFLCTICAVPLGQYLWEISTNAKAGEKISLLPKSFAVFSYADQERDREELRLKTSGIGYGLDLTRLYNVKTIENAKKFESSIEEESWLLKALGPAVENLLIGTLGSGSRDVYCGRDGWLFFRPTIEYLTGPGFLDPGVMKRRALSGTTPKEAVQPDPVSAIVDFRDQLAQRGIELVVLPSPAKATIYPERFSARYAQISTPLQNPSYPEFVRRLEARGIRVFDPAPLLLQAKGKKELFLKTDTHWSPAGAELVARNLADYLEKNRLLPGKTPCSYPQLAAHAENAGDLAAMLKGSKEYGYGKERVELRQIRQPDGTPWSASPDAEILFLGDSYANIFSLDGMGWGTGSGLVEQLGFHLRRPVDSILINDKGSFTTRQQLGNELKRGQDRLAGKKVVVYEFAARELALGNWKLIDLSLGKRAERPQTAAAAQAVEAAKAAPDGVQVEGVIEEITRPPRPGSTAYKDAVIAIHLKQVTSGGKPFAGSQIVVFCWGMRDDVATAATRYRRGERVALKLRPWSQVERKYGSYQRIELQNDDAVFLDIFWLAQPEDGGAAAAPASRQDAKGAVAVSDGIQAASNPALAKPQPAAGVTRPAAGAPQPAGLDAKLLFQKRLLEIGGSKEEARFHTGVDGWLFSRQELDHISKGEFWGEAAQTTSLAGKPDSRDPLAAIIDFKQQLERAGIELIVVPVPAKAHVYPDKFVAGIAAEQAGSGTRFDPVHQQFLAALEKAGVDYLDLTRLFLDARKGNAPPVFLQKDTHWSPYGITLVARALKQKIAPRPWFQALTGQKFTRKNESIQVKGDLLDEASAAAGLETVTVSRIVQMLDGRESSPAPDRNSPVVLLGDSHTLIFHSGGDMHAKDGGLPENLAFELGMNVDLVGVRGSGATPARVELARRRDNMAGKKLAIWCFTVREYTESVSGWRKVPVIR